MDEQAKQKRKTGFTIIELLIVIVIIAILAAITIVAYNGIQARANNSARLSEISEWAKLFSLYKTANGSFPTMTIGQEYCLGDGFPIGSGGVARCHSYTSSTAPLQSDNTTLMSQLQTMASLPSGPRAPVSGLAYPVTQFDGTVVKVDMTNQGTTTCPSGTTHVWDNGTDSTCRIIVN